MELVLNSIKYGDIIVTYDIEDLDKINSCVWYASKRNNKYYIQTSKGVLLHRFLLNPPRGMKVDHIDGNTLNNKRINLRVCTHKQNIRNSDVAKNNTSGYKGVCYDNYTNLWKVNIEVDAKRITAGRFSSKNEAAKKYNELAILYFGEYAKINEILESKEKIFKFKKRA